MRKRAARFIEEERSAPREKIIKIDDEIEVIITTPASPPRYSSSSRSAKKESLPCKTKRVKIPQMDDDDEVIVLSHRRPKMKPPTKNSAPPSSNSKEELKITYNPKVIKLECPFPSKAKMPIKQDSPFPFGSCSVEASPNSFFLPTAPPMLSPKVEPLDLMDSILEAETAPVAGNRMLEVASNVELDSKTPSLVLESPLLIDPRAIKVEPEDFPRQRRSFKKKNEKELLYEALHEIKWAQHYTPAYVLAKRNKRRPLKKALNYCQIASGKNPEKAAAHKDKKKLDLKAKISLAKKIKQSKKYIPKEKRTALLKTAFQKKNSAQEAKKYQTKNLKMAGPKTNKDAPAENNKQHSKSVVKAKPQLNQSLPKKLQEKFQEKKSVIQNSAAPGTITGVLCPKWKCDLKDKLTTKASKLETTIQGDKMVWKTEPLKTKKKKPEEEFSESLRMSVRQSECAFRYKDIAVRKHQNYIQIVLVPNSSRLNSLTLDGMKELREALHTALKDPGCRAVLLNSSGSIFCSGLDLNALVSANRKKAAIDMALALKELVQVLSRFPKPLVAAVNGATVGFGVTLLTYCDVVLASDKATFSMPYGRLGHIPEGAATLTLPPVVGTALATAMLLRDVRLSAQQALRHGLVSEVLWPSSLMEEVLPRVLKLANQPLQVMETTKIMVRWHLWDKFQSTLDYEASLLPQQWLSPFCQQAMRQALARHMYLID